MVASRYTSGGTAGGLADRTRVLVSKVSTALTRAMFPIRLKDVSDPMTGFFLVDRRVVDPAALTPRGFKILLEILARTNAAHRRGAVRRSPTATPASPRRRCARDCTSSPSSPRCASARCRCSPSSERSAPSPTSRSCGASPTSGVEYIVAAIIAAETTILGNFLLQERFVFQDMRGAASGVGSRFAKSFAFNNAEALIRIPIIALMVESWHFSSVIAAAITLIVAFFARFVFHSLVVYAPAKPGIAPSRARHLVEELDAQAMQPGEL